MTKYDKALILTVAIFSLIGTYISLSRLEETASKSLYIEINGEEYKEIVFDSNTEQTISIDNEYGYNKILIKDGKAVMLEADCPDQICVQEEGIYRAGELIICLPNRVVLEIKGNSDETEIDYISN